IFSLVPFCVFALFFFTCCSHPPLHSFPTRRSSDLCFGLSFHPFLQKRPAAAQVLSGSNPEVQLVPAMIAYNQLRHIRDHNRRELPYLQRYRQSAASL